MTDPSTLSDRDLDARVAAALGWTGLRPCLIAPDESWGNPPNAAPDIENPVPAYSTSWAAMGDLLAALRERGMDIAIHADVKCDADGCKCDEWQVEISRASDQVDMAYTQAPTLPRAVAEAAVLALEDAS